VTMTAPQTDHRCASERRCVNKVDGKPRETEKPNTFCPSCLQRTQTRIEQLPEQWVRLHHMIGDRHAGVDVNIRRPKPGGTVPLNLHIDTLLGSIVTDLTTAGEVVADKMNMNNPEHTDAAKQVQACVRIIAPNLSVLMAATGVGGRDDDDRAIDVMAWTPNGAFHMPSTTTGVDLVKSLDHLGSLAYFTLGLTRQRTQRDLPCTRCRARTVGRWAGSEYFDCASCGSQFPEDELRRQDRILLELHKRGLLPQADS
jgi:hypothetical protein